MIAGLFDLQIMGWGSVIFGVLSRSMLFYEDLLAALVVYLPGVSIIVISFFLLMSRCVTDVEFVYKSGLFMSVGKVSGSLSTRISSDMGDYRVGFPFSDSAIDPVDTIIAVSSLLK